MRPDTHVKPWLVALVLIGTALLSAWFDMEPPSCPTGSHRELAREWVCVPDKKAGR